MIMKIRSVRSLQSHAAAILAIPLVLSGCGIITGACNYEARSVSVAGNVIEGGTEVASATANFHAVRHGRLPLLSFYWRFSAPSLEGHVTSVVLVNSVRPVPILLDLPIREPIEPWGYAYAYEGTLEQRAGEPTPALGGIYEVLAARNGVLELTTDLPARPLVSIPLAVTHQENWHRPICS